MSLLCSARRRNRLRAWRTNASASWRSSRRRPADDSFHHESPRSNSEPTRAARAHPTTVVNVRGVSTAPRAS